MKTIKLKLVVLKPNWHILSTGISEYDDGNLMQKYCSYTFSFITLFIKFEMKHNPPKPLQINVIYGS